MDFHQQYNFRLVPVSYLLTPSLTPHLLAPALFVFNIRFNRMSLRVELWDRESYLKGEVKLTTFSQGMLLSCDRMLKFLKIIFEQKFRQKLKCRMNECRNFHLFPTPINLSFHFRPSTSRQAPLSKTPKVHSRAPARSPITAAVHHGPQSVQPAHQHYSQEMIQPPPAPRSTYTPQQMHNLPGKIMSYMSRDQWTMQIKNGLE